MSAKSILIIRCGALGDLVYATGVIDALKTEFGDDTIIDFVCTPGTGTLFSNDPRVHQVFSLKHKKIPIFLSSDKKKILKYAQSSPYDILINFEFGKQFKSLVQSINAKKKVGALTQDFTFPPSVIHMADVAKYLYKSIISQDIYNTSFPNLVGSNRKTLLEKHPLESRYIVISPSNSHQKRNILNYRAWEDQRWKELIQKLALEIQVVIVGNKNEDDFFNKLLPFPKNVLNLVAKTSLIDLVGIISEANALVATDTGTAHIAAAVNTEVFTLIGPTPADETGPYKTPYNKVHIISSNQECAPCYKTQAMKNCKNNICMKEIHSEDVYQAIKSANIL